MLDNYTKKKLNTTDSRYVVIDLKEMKIDIIKEQAELNNKVAPLEKVDTYIVNDKKNISILVDEIIKNYKN